QSQAHEILVKNQSICREIGSDKKTMTRKWTIAVPGNIFSSQLSLENNETTEAMMGALISLLFSVVGILVV
ncbi:hypothetical protein PFISCL1PPCAC_2630, partial [Pristionchus fissidentatus]